MTELIFHFIEATFGSPFAVTLAVLALAFWLTHFVTKKITEINYKHKDLKEQASKIEEDIHEIRIDLADCGNIKKQTEKVEEDIHEIRKDLSDCKSLDKKVEKIEEDIHEIRIDLAYIKGNIDIFKAGRAKNAQSDLMQSNSPISLTDEGKRVAEELRAEEIIDKNWERIRTTMERVRGKNAYDIQQFCIERASTAPEWFFDTETIDRVKMYAFRKGMPVQLYLRLLGLLIRDRYFKENGIPLYEVDDNQPE